MLECDINEVDEARKYMKKKYDFGNVQPATIIKTRDIHTQAFVVTFQDNHLPYSMYIAGEGRIHEYTNSEVSR